MERHVMVSEQDPSSVDFGSTSTVVLRCSINSKGVNTEFVWTDYSIPVFRKLQEFQEIDIDDYMLSICGRETIKLLAHKKNVSSIRLPNDDRFVLQPITKSQMKVFLVMLPKYYLHLKNNKNTLLTKYYGLHLVKPQQGGLKVRFLVCENIFQSDLSIHKQFVLRVPQHGRQLSKIGAEEDLNIIFHLETSLRHRLMILKSYIWQLKNDCNFLEEVGIVHYNLLLGMHFCPAPFEAVLQARQSSPHVSGSEDVYKRSVGPKSEHSDADQASIPDNGSISSCPAGNEGQLGVKIAARAVGFRKKEHCSAFLHTAGKDQLNNVFLFVGIVDIFHGYSMLKHVEHVFRSLHTDSPSISGANPRAYSNRFQEHFCQIFPENCSDANVH